MLDFLVRHWGDMASLVGLVISAFTLIFAKRASKAAEEARDSVLRQTLRQEMEACTLGDEHGLVFQKDTPFSSWLRSSTRARWG
jgi:hypothetical protein